MHFNCFVRPILTGMQYLLLVIVKGQIKDFSGFTRSSLFGLLLVGFPDVKTFFLFSV